MRTLALLVVLAVAACPVLGQNMGASAPHVASKIDAATLDRVDNAAPPGFTALFNGKDLEGWKGLLKAPLDNPAKRAPLAADQRAKAQAEADENMRQHWKVQNGVLIFDGDRKGRSLCTASDYGDFEMYCDWKIEKGGDSGIYLRGSPQVQIWDPANKASSGIGSGGLYNNQKGPHDPTLYADLPIGQWNRFYIKMVGDKVTVQLNGNTVADGVVLENYWERDKPIYSAGTIELQNHNSPLQFKNIYVRKIERN